MMNITGQRKDMLNITFTNSATTDDDISTIHRMVTALSNLGLLPDARYIMLMDMRPMDFVRVEVGELKSGKTL